MGRTTLGYAAIAATGIALAVGAACYWWHDYGVLQAHYRQNASQDARVVADKVETALTSIYQNLRTLSFLPSIRTVGRHGESLSDEARTTIQQVYNNLASSVAVSEVYVLPVDFDPDKIDPATGHHEAPILAFDQLISPSHIDAAAAVDSANNTTEATADEDFAGEKDEAGFPQIEIQEYRELRRQLDWLKANAPSLSAVDAMRVPMIGSHEVITCDNTTYDTTKNDVDRSGLIQLVPFYGSDGQLKGGVAAVMLSKAYRDLLPSGDYALVNTTYEYVTPVVPGSQNEFSASQVKAGQADARPIYSEVLKLATPDTNGAWAIWAGHPNATFDGSSEVTSLKVSAIACLMAIALLTIGAAIVFRLVLRAAAVARMSSAELEKRVGERTAESIENAARAQAAMSASLERVAQTSSLNEDLAIVVERAIAGDFSARLDTSLPDPGLRALATRVNDLIATFHRGIDEIGATLAAMARTDLTRRVRGDFAGGLGQLKDDTNAVADRLTTVIGRLRESSATVRTAMAEIAAATEDLATRSSAQAGEIQRTSADISQLGEITAEITRQAGSADKGAQVLGNAAAETGRVVAQANDAMQRISASSAKISNIIGMIDDVAFQTNLLALNASVEAARAGDAGLGFAVVAVEVRRLAQTAASASAEVKNLILEASADVVAGDRLVSEATSRINAMVTGIRDNGSAIAAIAKATQDQSATIVQLARGMSGIEEMTHRNAQMVNETTAAIARTVDQASDLDQQVDVFVLEAGRHPERPVRNRLVR